MRTLQKSVLPGLVMTHSGRLVNPLDLHHEDIDLYDIANALSKICRFNGQCIHFHSVAAHSVQVAKRLPYELRLWGLLHDASEAYLMDLPKPLKVLPEFAFYVEAECRAMKVICERFDLPITMPAEVDEADQRMLLTEFRDIFDTTVQGSAMTPYPETIDPWSPGRAYDNFIAALLPHVDPEELPNHNGSHRK